MTYCLAIDIGASSGRHVLGYIDNGKLKLEEVYRFENGFVNDGGALVWDTQRLFFEVREGIAKCREIGKIPQTVAIDTWGVDYVLVDSIGRELLPAYCYRDSRTKKAIEQLEQILPADRLYAATGIQKQPYNTIYQLYADKLSGKLDKAEYMLMMPQYLSYKLTGVMSQEYTLATTSALVNAETKQWDTDIIDTLGLPRRLFGKLSQPTDTIGNLLDDVRDYVGFDCTVVSAPSHDTASAVASCPMDNDDLFISSGTWSLIGTESLQPIISDSTREANFANEGGVDYRFRFLKNYMGMWLMQNIRKALNKKYTYDEMMNMAESAESYAVFDVNDGRLMAPENMIEAVRDVVGQPQMPIEQVLSSVYHSLANSYKAATEEIEALTGKRVGALHIVGGGSKDGYLNRLTRDALGRPVTAGPVEATAVGNLLIQLISCGQCENLADARNLVRRSFDIAEV